MPGASLVGRHLEVSPVSDGQQRCLDQSPDGPVAQCEHVLDHPRRRGDFSVAVMPSELEDVEKVESG